MILSNEPYAKSQAEISRLDRWYIINVLLFPRDPKTGWPVTEKVERTKPDRINGDRFEAFRYDMERAGVRDWVIRPEFERRTEAKRIKQEQDRAIVAEMIEATRRGGR